MNFENPNNVLIPVEGLEWNPERPIDEAIKMAEEALKTSVDEINFDVKLKGHYANKFHFIKTLLLSLGMPESEINSYLLCSGIEEQFRKLAQGARTS